MRVLIVGLHYSPEPSGNAPYTTALARGLATRGHDVKVLTGVPHYPEWRVREGFGQWRTQSRDFGVKVVRLRHYVPRRPTLARRVLMETTFGARVAVHGLRQPLEADVVVCVSPALLSSAMTVMRERSRASRPALGLWVQDIYSSGVRELHGESRAAAMLSRAEGAAMRRVDGVAVAHERFRASIVGALGVQEDRVTVVRNWAHFEPLAVGDETSIRAKLGWGSDVVVLHAGNMGMKQGLENVVQAARLADVARSRVRFVLLGGGNQEEFLRESAQGIKRVQFVPSLGQKDFEAALVAADVLLVNERPGVAEMSVPSKLTSYFIAGRPVVAATAKGSVTAHEIEISGAGVEIESGDPAALLAAAEDLASDPAKARELGRRGTQYARARLGEGAALDRLEEWITGLVARRRAEID